MCISHRLDTVFRLRLCYRHIALLRDIVLDTVLGDITILMGMCTCMWRERRASDRACLEIKVYREIGKRACLQTHVCMCAYK